MKKKEITLIFVSTLTAFVAAELLLSLGDRFFRLTDTYAHESRNNSNIELHDTEHHFCNTPKKMYIENELVRYREQPNHQYFEFKNDSVSFFEFNEHGFRGNWISNTDRNAIVLGDSFVRGTLADNTETIPAFLDRWSETTQYVNLGTSGHGPLQHYLTYQEFESEFNPEFVLLVLFIGNDLRDNVEFRNWQQADVSVKKKQSPFSRLKGTLRSAGFYNLTIGKLVKKARTQSTLTAQPTALELHLLQESLELLSLHLSKTNTPLIVGLLPNLIEFTSPDLLEVSPTEYGDTAREFVAGLSTELDFSIVDLKSSLVQSSAESGTPVNEYYGWPDAHLVEIGYYEIARSLATTINNLGLDNLDIEKNFIDKTNYKPETVSCP